MRELRAPDCLHCLEAAIAAASNEELCKNVPRGRNARTAVGNTEPPSSAAADACTSQLSPRTRGSRSFGQTSPV